MSTPSIVNPAPSPELIKARKDGLLFLFLGCAVFLLMGTALEMAAPVSTVDFRIVYYSARCLLDHRDPYNSNDLDYTYRMRGGETSQDSIQIRRTERMYNYLPTAFPITAPFALLPFNVAQKVWLILTAALISIASYLIWSVAGQTAPLVAGVLAGLSLTCSELFLILGNPAGIAIGLCVIAICCLSKHRFVNFGLVCFAISLMLKPHDGGLIWLYLVLSGPVNRRHALKILALVLLFSGPAMFWVSHVAPNWLTELQTTLRIYSSHGDVNDPGPTSIASHGIGMVISLQAVLSLIHDDPRFYTPFTYLICAPLLIVWIKTVLRSPQRKEIDWLAVAPIAALSLLPIYHRVYDARLLLLVIPACASIWGEHGRKAWCAVLGAAFAIGITGAMPWAIFLRLLKQGRLSSFASSPQLLAFLQVAPIPLALLLLGSFLLWVYVQHSARREGTPH